MCGHPVGRIRQSRNAPLHPSIGALRLTPYAPYAAVSLASTASDTSKLE
jgi:hypothetical protein